MAARASVADEALASPSPSPAAGPLGVDAATPIAEVARQMVERHMHHVVVTDKGRVVGVVSALDFVRRFADDPPGPA